MNMNLDGCKDINEIWSELEKTEKLIDWIGEKKMKNVEDVNSVRSFKNLSYQDYFNALKEKYGELEYNYYEQWWIDKDPEDEKYTLYKSKKFANAAIPGLSIHHYGEHFVGNLNDKHTALENDFVFQVKKNLCYCNAIEHLILHLMIIRDYKRDNSSNIIPLLISCAVRENSNLLLWKDIIDEFKDYYPTLESKVDYNIFKLQDFEEGFYE